MNRTLLAPFALACALLWPAAAPAQGGRVDAAEESLRATPGGTVIATLYKGTELRLGERRGEWREATVDGWIWSRSIAPEQRDGHDLIVRVSGGENLRIEPSGNRIARARTGMLLDRVEQRGDWVRVRRTGWIRQAALAAGAAEPAADPADEAAPDGKAAPDTAAATPIPAGTAADWARAGQAGATLQASPASDTVATIRPMAPVEVLARQGNWARVRMEGWVWVPSLAAPRDTSAVLRNIPADVLAANPQGFNGRVVEWDIQFIALERAEKIRTDFYEGEPFILARGPGGDAGFVYVAVPPDRLEAVERLAPLERLTIVARVRTARSPLMGAPVLDLLQIR